MNTYMLLITLLHADPSVLRTDGSACNKVIRSIYVFIQVAGATEWGTRAPGLTRQAGKQAGRRACAGSGSLPSSRTLGARAAPAPGQTAGQAGGPALAWAPWGASRRALPPPAGPSGSVPSWASLAAGSSSSRRNLLFEEPRSRAASGRQL